MDSLPLNDSNFTPRSSRFFEDFDLDLHLSQYWVTDTGTNISTDLEPNAAHSRSKERGNGDGRHREESDHRNLSSDPGQVVYHPRFLVSGHRSHSRRSSQSAVFTRMKEVLDLPLLLLFDPPASSNEFIAITTANVNAVSVKKRSLSDASRTSDRSTQPHLKK